MFSNSLSRRAFLGQSSALAGASMMLGGAAPAFALPKREAISLQVEPSNKALVFIMLDGGNDSFNMLVPTSNQHYAEYKRSRSNLALGKQQLLPLSGYQDDQRRQFGVHPSMPEVQQLFADKKLAFVANTGPMIEPVSKSNVESAQLPLGLLSHADQFNHWQTARPDARINHGWMGSLADNLQPNRSVHQVPMNISLAGSNIVQNGVESSHYSINQQGSVGLVVNAEPTPLNQELLGSFEQLLQQNYAHDPIKHSYLSITREAQALHQQFAEATDNVSIPTEFVGTDLSQQLRKVAQTIKASQQLGLRQQTYFLRYIGWDHHDELLNNHSSMLRVVSQAMGEFQQALDSMGLADQVVTFTGSDFGRTLTSNGNGTDHGWGGNMMVMGSKVAGGQVFGKYPELQLGGQQDMGDGVLIPTTPVDQVFADLVRWYGVDERGVVDLFPNLRNFALGSTSLGLFA